MAENTENEEAVKKESVWHGFMEKYPILFQQKNLTMDKTCMCWGIECPEGWYDTVKDVCDKIEAINNTVGKDHHFEIQAIQVKEKFGTLRFYLNSYPQENATDEEMETARLFEEICEDIVVRAEYLTESVCQVCGRPIFEGNKVVSRGWIGYYCPECAEKKGVIPWEDIPKEPCPPSVEDSEKRQEGTSAQ